ncbi:MAG TPA: TetR/AcrR family transcriptional regulator [Rhodospirillales bacterium]|nr:TetR/AcrR family transcriptional regulator [Rhodospirillales bacterium]
MSVTQRKSAAVRREEIVQAALALIAGRGPGALTTAAIARHIGVSEAALFRHYPSKSAILIACIEWMGDRMRPAIFVAAAVPGPPEQRLRRIVATILSVARAIPAMPTTMFSRELLAEFPELKEMLRERRRALHTVLAALLDEGKADGSFAPDLDSTTAAWLVMGMVHSLLFRHHHIDDDLDLDDEAKTMLDILLLGLKRRGT